MYSVEPPSSFRRAFSIVGCGASTHLEHRARAEAIRTDSRFHFRLFRSRPPDGQTRWSVLHPRRVLSAVGSPRQDHPSERTESTIGRESNEPNFRAVPCNPSFFIHFTILIRVRTVLRESRVRELPIRLRITVPSANYTRPFHSRSPAPLPSISRVGPLCTGRLGSDTFLVWQSSPKRVLLVGGSDGFCPDHRRIAPFIRVGATKTSRIDGEGTSSAFASARRVERSGKRSAWRHRARRRTAS